MSALLYYEAVYTGLLYNNAINKECIPSLKRILQSRDYTRQDCAGEPAVPRPATTLHPMTLRGYSYTPYTHVKKGHTC